MKRASVVRHFRCGSGGLGAVEPGGRGGGSVVWCGGCGFFWVGFVVWGLGFVGYMGEIERGKMTILDDARGGGGGVGVGGMVCFKRVGCGWWLSIRP